MADALQCGETHVSDLPGDRWLVTLTGEHDLSTAGDLREKLHGIFRTGTTVVVDLTATRFIDSTVLGVLMEADRQAQADGCEHFAVVVQPETPPDRLFQMAGVQRCFTIFDSPGQAFAAFDAQAQESEQAVAERRTARRQRIVKNEQAFRDYNDRRMQAESVDENDDLEQIPFVCECGDQDCIEALMTTAAEFTETHSAPNRFIVKPGHVYPDVEQVIADYDTFAIVEKHAATLNSGT